ncbi:MAG TPA: AsnC family transcriptional regulator [Anaerohalosphaeraceae bacterium]|jgi:DNA-binding Lrp family transcriptional regulator|nr:AsnC family transcriptional regulator [Anaerohalosphaeraceae bacterium]HRT51860.1 AsnC family transcriptional regulator [Anaerohalosphaeraceae bacterium]HRT87898.1 AsnC family transcriptional regulator [Anaerohalosphaeraceae bacterium]
MDDLDKKIIAAMQDDFPLADQPYKVIARVVGADVDEVFRRVRSLVHQGVIRRLGVSLDSRKLGYSSTLAAVRVLADRVEAASETIAAYPEVTHSYLRDNAYNIWFTLIAPDSNAIAAILAEIREKLQLSADDVLNLPVRRLFKLDARFKPAD